MTPPNPHPINHNPLLWTDTLELITSKENAHNDQITSVDFNKDGDKIVSGSWDKTIKVWGAGVTPDTIQSPPNH